EIAQRLGYSSPYEFSAQFRKQVGVPPSSYRPR
ncbi:MAG: helix-turn-helix transcriptional regulator, partial [Lentisphaeria bacterium]|nr:helix-turn-helix transcriptional regulator [Lentisphaeria bacterium]